MRKRRKTCYFTRRKLPHVHFFPDGGDLNNNNSQLRFILQVNAMQHLGDAGRDPKKKTKALELKELEEKIIFRN